MAGAAGVTIFAWRRPVMFDRKIAGRTVVKTGRSIAERIAAQMPEEKSAGWIVRIKWPGIVASRAGTMRGPLRWTGLIALSGRNVRNGRNGPSAHRDRNVRNDLRGLDGISSEPGVDGGETAASGDLPGAAVVWSGCGGYT